MRIFVIHYAKLAERKVHIINQFKKHNIVNYEFIEIDRDELEKENTNVFQSGYTKSQIAISLSHFYAYKEISKKYDRGLIFEDDVILHPNFTTIFNSYLTEIPNDYDMLYIGDGCNLHIPVIKRFPNKHIYQKGLQATSWGGMGSSRCTDSYLISKKCANKLCEYIDTLNYKINIPVDNWMNVAALHNNFKVYWAEPTIITQGTQNGMFKSSHD
jgi:glycosyl transferase family 25